MRTHGVLVWFVVSCSSLRQATTTRPQSSGRCALQGSFNGLDPLERMYDNLFARLFPLVAFNRGVSGFPLCSHPIEIPVSILHV